MTVRLTEAELTVLTLMAEGEGRQSVAGRMGISVMTVKQHLENVYSKLGSGGLVRTYYELGWLRVPGVPVR